MRETPRLHLYLIALIASIGLLLAACSVDEATDTTDTVELSSAAQSDGEPDGSSTTDGDSSSDETGEVTLGTGGSWTPEDVADLTIDETNSIPVIDETLADDRVFEDYWTWDWWPVRTRDGEVAEIDGYQIAIALTAPADVLPGKRHDIATHRYGLSSDGGRTWQLAGEVFGAEQALGSRQWAGSAMYDEDENKLYAFYTVAGEVGDPVEEAAASTDPDEETEFGPSGGPIRPDISYRQQMGLATADVVSDDDGVRFENWSDHEVLFSGDETGLYASTEATEGGAGSIDAFRDPWFYRDADTGEEYVLFTATMPSAECEGDGVVGIARATSDDLFEYEILPPLLDGHCVNNELERPHIIDSGGNTYLLFTTHAHTFRDGATGPEGYYGFVADDLFGPYEPLNGTGLVLANPADAPYQSYSWMGLHNGVITSFFQFFGIEDDVEISYIGTQSPEFQRAHFGGTFAPSLVVEFDGATTRIIEEIEPGAVQTRSARQTGDTGSNGDESESTRPGDDGRQVDNGASADTTTPEGGVDAGFGGAASMLADGGS